MDALALEINGVAKRYGAHPVLDAVSLALAGGDFVGLIGINGAGKTTLIKSTLGLCRIDAGTIRLNGRPHTDALARAEVAYLPERFLPPAYLTGFDVLDYALQLYGASVDRPAIEACVEGLDLAPAVLRQLVRTYSKGMTQKLGLAACLLSGKRLLVLDEPMSGLDPKARSLVKQALAAAHGAGRAVLMSSHMLADIHALCNRAVVLHRGAIRFDGTPAAFAERYGAADPDAAFIACIEGVP